MVILLSGRRNNLFPLISLLLQFSERGRSVYNSVCKITLSHIVSSLIGRSAGSSMAVTLAFAQCH